MSEGLNEAQAERVLEVIMSYARLEFTEKCELAHDGTIIDGVAAGVNMLGEELQSSVMSLKEKEHLLREIHHRVKNNMQIISSMLRLQNEFVNDPQLENALGDCQSRISSMALIHEMLYVNTNFQHTNLNVYIQRLIQRIAMSYHTESIQIDYELDVNSEIMLDIDTMIPLGLILNECVSNIYKHAFEGRKEGKYYVEVAAGEKCIDMKIGDNGTGLLNTDKCQKQSMGTQLITLLSEQLNADLEIINQDGLHYHLKFNIETKDYGI